MTTETEEGLARAQEQAQAQLESIRAMVARLDHSQDCNGEDCELTDAEILEGLSLAGDAADEEDRTLYHNEDAAIEAIRCDALSFEVRSDWHGIGEDTEDTEYAILLCTGGPAVRITGELDGGVPATASLEYQDWFTPWTDAPLSAADKGALISYAAAIA